MKKLIPLIFFLIVLSSGVLASGSITCKEASFDLDTTDPYAPLLTVVPTQVLEIYTDCTLEVKEGSNGISYFEGLSLTLEASSKEFILTAPESVSGLGKFLLNGFDLEIPSLTQFSFTKDGLDVTIPSGSIIEINDRNGRGVLVTSQGDIGHFSFQPHTWLRVYPGVEGKEVIALDFSSLDSSVLVRPSLKDGYNFIFNGYGLQFDSEYDRAQFTEDEELLVSLNPQSFCSQSVDKAFSFFVQEIQDDEQNYGTGYSFISVEEVCNQEIILQNKGGVADSTKSITFISGQDDLDFTFAYLEQEDVAVNREKVAGNTYSLTLNKDDRFLVYQSLGGYSADVRIAEADKESEAVPIELCGKAQYDYGASDTSTAHLAEGSSFTVSFRGDSDRCLVESCFYKGVTSGGAATGELTVWCGEHYPQFVVDNTQDLQGLQYKEGVWSCQKEDCFGTANVNFYPVKTDAFVRLINSEFESYSTIGQRLEADKFYVGGEKNYLVKADDGKVTFAEGSLLLTMESGELKDSTTGVGYSLEKGSNSYDVRFDKPGTTDLESIDCCGSKPSSSEEGVAITCGKKQARNQFLASLLRTQLLEGSCSVAADIQTPLDLGEESIRGSLEEDGVADASLPKLTEKVVVEGEKGAVEVLQSSEAAKQTVAQETTPSAIHEDGLCHVATDDEPWEGECQCGSRAELDPDFLLIDKSYSGGLWTSSECMNSPYGCTVEPVCNSGLDNKYYCCSADAAREKPFAGRYESQHIAAFKDTQFLLAKPEGEEEEQEEKVESEEAVLVLGNECDVGDYFNNNYWTCADENTLMYCSGSRGSTGVWQRSSDCSGTCESPDELFVGNNAEASAELCVESDEDTLVSSIEKDISPDAACRDIGSTACYSEVNSNRVKYDYVLACNEGHIWEKTNQCTVECNVDDRSGEAQCTLAQGAPEQEKQSLWRWFIQYTP